MSVFHFYNVFHIGDNLLNLKFFLYVGNFLKERNYKIMYYYETNYIYNKKETLMQYVDPELVELKPLDEKPPESIHLWMGIDKNGVSHIEFERYFEEFYKELSKCLNIDTLPLNNSLWLEDSSLLDVYDALAPKFKDVDILILNNKGMSGQYNDTTPLNELAHYLNSKFNVVTVCDIGIKSASTLSLKEIGAISTHSKYIIAPNSGPLIPCLNSYTKKYVKKWFFVGNMYTWYSIDHVECGVDVTPIREYFDSL